MHIQLRSLSSHEHTATVLQDGTAHLIGDRITSVLEDVGDAFVVALSCHTLEEQRTGTCTGFCHASSRLFIVEFPRCALRDKIDGGSVMSPKTGWARSLRRRLIRRSNNRALVFQYLVAQNDRNKVSTRSPESCLQ